MTHRKYFATLVMVGATACANVNPPEETSAVTEEAWVDATNLGANYTYANNQSALASPMGYIKCADEWGTCSGVAARHIAYGANGTFTFRDNLNNQMCGDVACQTDSFSCSNSTFGDPIPGPTKACYFSPYSYIASEWGSFTVAGTKRSVAFGVDNSFVYKTLAGGTYPCDASTFDGVDPAPGRYKTCLLGAVDYSVFRVDQGGSFRTEMRNLPVAYGAHGSFNYKVLTGTVNCNDETFGDPAPGFQKACYSVAAQFGRVAGEGGSYSYGTPSCTGLCLDNRTTLMGDGVNGAFKYISDNGTGSCTNDHFGGDPSPTIAKQCWGSQALTQFDGALWRVVSKANTANPNADRRTLTRSSDGNLVGATYSGNRKQQWRLRNAINGLYELVLESTNQCLVSSGTAALLGECGGPTSFWTIDTARARTEARPALYRVRSASGCLSLDNPSQAAVVPCSSSSVLYVEPVGYGERKKASEYELRTLLIVKSETNVLSPPIHSTIDPAIVDAAQVSFKSHVAKWYERMTDGRIVWKGASVVSTNALSSLAFEGGNYLPAAYTARADVQQYVPIGTYDSVAIFFKDSPGRPGGWGWGPGISPESNYTMWVTVNGGNTDASSWTSWNHEPTEVFIHEPMHGMDGFFSNLGISLPDGWLHGAELNFYSNEEDGWMPWYRDYLLGTVIASDDTYRGYGPRAFRKGTPRQAALSHK